MEITDEERATYLAALAAEGGYVEMPGSLALDTIPDDRRLLVLTDLERRGQVEVRTRMANGMGILVGAHNVSLTAGGRLALENYQRSLHRSGGQVVMPVPFEEKRRRRAAFMRALYDVTDGRQLIDVDSHQLGSTLGLSDDDTDAVVEFLANEQLLEYAGLGGLVSITHRGVDEVEQALRQPDHDTEHFPAGSVVVQVFGDVTGSLQAAGAGSNQQLTVLPDTAVIHEFLAEFERALPDLPVDEDERAAASADAQALALQLASPKPRPAVVRALTTTLVGVALGVAGNGTYDGLVVLARRLL